MGNNSGRSKQMSNLLWRLSRVSRLSRWAMLAGGSAILSGLVGILPALADELADWDYNPQTRALSFVVPETVTPIISVPAPDRLMLELPNTQVGEVTSQAIEDGLVERIVLEQATPDILRVVVDFAPGTVLSNTQQAIQMSSSNDELRRWQVQPTLAASRNSPGQSNAAIASSPSDPLALSQEAANLRTAPENTLAQAPDFPDLPVLEPAIPIGEPVTVPPLETPQEALPAAVEPIPAVPIPVDSGSSETIAVETIPVEVVPAEMPLDGLEAPQAEEIANDQIPEVMGEQVVEAPRAAEQFAVEEDPTHAEAIALPATEPLATPLEPPFIGSVGIVDAENTMPETLVEEADAGNLPEALAETMQNGQETAAETAALTEPETPGPNADEVAVATPTTVVEWGERPADSGIRPANVQRWPEPILFGQPLPK